MARDPFRYTFAKRSPRLAEIAYIGFMDEDASRHLEQTAELFASATQRVGLCYLVPEMTGFHRSQVARHAELFSKHLDRISGIAVVGARPVIRFGAIRVALLSNTNLQTFETQAEGLRWLESLPAELAKRTG